ncbi:MAG: YggS family pyridoxal phosphate-dependent enzyme [Opitutales bacterium]
MLVDPDTFSRNLKALRDRMARCCEACNRDPESVELLPVTKTHPPEAIRYVVEAGLTAIGENRVQEAVAKKADGTGPDLRWELIGHLQTNKARQALDTFDRIQSVDSLKLARRLDRLAGQADRRLPVLIQVNTGEDPRKYGFTIDAFRDAWTDLTALEHLQIDGLMTIAPLDDDPAVAGKAFCTLRDLRSWARDAGPLPLDVLSMGMTGDLEAAIAAGSTQIRVGTALFGERPA